MRSYRAVLAITDVWTTLLLTALVRIPMFSLGMVLTVHVVTTLGLSYRLAGLVTTVITIASMISSPWRGSMVDRRGLRRTITPSVVILVVVWSVAPWVGYLPLLALCAIGGLWTYPVYTVPRQVLIARTSLAQRRAALSLDAVSVEICYMIGPTLAIVAATSVGTRPTIMACTAVAALGAVGLMVRNPATADLSQAEGPDTPQGRARWLTPTTFALLVAVCAAGFALGSLELTTVAAMRAMGSPGAIGWVLAASALGSALGGIVYGMMPRGASTPVLLIAMGATTGLAALAHSPWQAAVLLAVGGIFVAPTLTSSVDSLSTLVPASVRGAVIGWQGSSLNAGIALAAPLVGAAIDATRWQSGFLAGGATALVVGLAVQAVVRLARGRRHRRSAAGRPLA